MHLMAGLMREDGIEQRTGNLRVADVEAITEQGKESVAIIEDATTGGGMRRRGGDALIDGDMRTPKLVDARDDGGDFGRGSRRPFTAGDEGAGGSGGAAVVRPEPSADSARLRPHDLPIADGGRAVIL